MSVGKWPHDEYSPKLGELSGSIMGGKDLTYERYTAFWLEVVTEHNPEVINLMKSFKQHLQQKFAKVLSSFQGSLAK